MDSGASIHICSNPELMVTTFRLREEVKIHLPYGSSKPVHYGGKVKLNEHIVLENVLYVLGFTHDLIYVSQLIEELGIKCIFYKTHCIFQKNSSDQLLGVGKMKGNLYVLDTVSEKYYCSFFNHREMSVENWHVFLGHPSLTTMKHMKNSERQAAYRSC